MILGVEIYINRFFNKLIQTVKLFWSILLFLFGGEPKFIEPIDVTTGDVVKSFFVENPEPKKPIEKDKKGQSPPLEVDWHCM